MPSIGKPPSALPVITVRTPARSFREFAALALLSPSHPLSLSLSLSRSLSLALFLFFSPIEPIRPDYTFRFGVFGQ